MSRRCSFGISLAELLLAMVLLSVGIVSLVVVQAYAARARSLDQIHLMAAQKAGSAIAELEERACADFDANLEAQDLDLGNGLLMSVDVQDDWNGSATLKRVRVTVTYPSNHEATRGRTSATKVFRRSK